MTANSSIDGTWEGARAFVPAEQWQCGFCSQFTRSNLGYFAQSQNVPGLRGSIKICGNCNAPTFFGWSRQHPAPVPAGEPIRNLAKDVESLFQQARAALGAGAPVAAALTCRKILHHVAVEKRGIAQGKFDNFKLAVDWLNANHYLPPGGEKWVDFVRDRANEENHQIVIIGQADAERMLVLTGHLLRHVYDLPSLI